MTKSVTSLCYFPNVFFVSLIYLFFLTLREVAIVVCEKADEKMENISSDNNNDSHSDNAAMATSSLCNLQLCIKTRMPDYETLKSSG
jgi:hypothetical protein